MAVHSDGVVKYAGRVLSKETREERVMSDVYAPVSRAMVVLDDGTLREVYVKAHFECDTRHAWAEVDATPEAKTLAFARAALDKAEAAVATTTALVAKLSKPAAPVVPTLPACRKGDTVMVTGKVAGLEKGSFHTVVWAGSSRYSGAERVGVAGANGGRIYCPASKVTRVASAEELETMNEVAAAATARNEATRVSDLAVMEKALATELAALPALRAAYEAARAAVLPMAVAA